METATKSCTVSDEKTDALVEVGDAGLSHNMAKNRLTRKKKRERHINRKSANQDRNVAETEKPREQ